MNDHERLAKLRELAHELYEEYVCTTHWELFAKELHGKILDILNAPAAQGEQPWSGTEMLDRIVSSLKEYPHGGGDIRVMEEVDRIVREDRVKPREKTAAQGEPAEPTRTQIEAITIMRFRKMLDRIGIHGYYGEMQREFGLEDEPREALCALQADVGRTESLEGHRWLGHEYEDEHCCACGWDCKPTRPAGYESRATCKRQHAAHVASLSGKREEGK